jgi:hypothetical protein
MVLKLELGHGFWNLKNWNFSNEHIKIFYSGIIGCGFFHTFLCGV